MPDALTTLLNLSSTTNRTPLSGYTPNINRNNTRTAVLAKFLGIPEQDETGGFASQQELESTYGDIQAERAAEEMRKAQAAALGERVRGEYGLEGERIKGTAAVEAARVAAERAAMEREAQREFTAGQNQMRETGIDRRAQQTQSGMAGRSSAAQAAISSRQRAGQAESRARAYETQDKSGNFKVNAPRPANEGFLSRYLFGKSQADLNREEAARIRQEALSGAANDTGGLADASDEELTSMILQRTPDASPEEIQQWIGEIRGGR